MALATDFEWRQADRISGGAKRGTAHFKKLDQFNITRKLIRRPACVSGPHQCIGLQLRGAHVRLRRFSQP